ncbi:MAG TPA: hypothetical protein VMN39_05440 [Longimicrobiaceae bacterium]|nr:hypothetical protein [Longimicrobiaceae bacterium]
MSRTRLLRAVGHAVRLLLFILVVLLAVRFFLDVVSMNGWGPGALFGLLLITGAISLVWRATIDFRKAVRRLRA